MIKKDVISSEMYENNEEYLIRYNLQINNIAIIESYTGQDKGLINLETGIVIGKVRNYKTYIEKNFFIQTYSEIDENSVNLVSIDRVRIYDTKNKKLLCDDFIIPKEFGSDDPYIFKNNLTGKYVVFSAQLGQFLGEFDDIQEYVDFSFKLLKVYKDGKCAVLSLEKGLITEYYDNDIDISVDFVYYNNICLKLVKVNDKFGIYYNGFLTSIAYDNIKAVKDVLVLERNGESYLFSSDLDELNEDNLILAKSSSLEFKEDVIIWNESNRVKVYSKDDNKIIIDIEADKIYYHQDRNNLIYEKEGIKNIVRKDGTVFDYSSINIEERGNCYIVNNDNDLCDIVYFNEYISYLKNVKIEELPKDVDNYILVTNESKDYVIVNLLENQCEKKFYDKKPNYVGNDYFVIEGDYVYIIIKGNQEVLSLKYSDDIEFRTDLDLLSFKCGGVYELLKLSFTDYGYKENEYIKGFYSTLLNGKNIKMYKNVVYVEAIDGKNKKSLYSLVPSVNWLINYDDKLPFRYFISQNNEYFLINGKWYFYDIDSERLLLANNNPVNFYIASYETDYGTIIVKEADKSVFDYKCKMIEETTNVEEILLENYNNNKILQLKFPGIRQE